MKQISRVFITSLTAAAVFREAAGADTTGTAAPAAAPEAPKLTPAEKRAAKIKLLFDRITKDTETYNGLVKEAETAERLASVGTGTVIVARIGRAETSKEIEATVLGVKVDDESGAVRYKITYGSGFEADTAIIQPSQIVSVQGGVTAQQSVAVSNEAAAYAEPQVEETVPANVVRIDENGKYRDEFDRILNRDGSIAE